jgi:tetratricopeptide (TPR) repeat protein
LTNRNGDAEKYLLMAVTANPDFMLSYKNLGILYETKLKQKDKALEYYNKYIQKIADGREKKVVGLWIQNLGGGK